MIQQEVIDGHLLDMKDMVAELQRHQSLSVDELQTDRLVLLAVERALQRAIQNLLDISMHELSGAGINDWDDYRGVILKLGEEGIVPAEFAQRICGMADTRNILPHQEQFSRLYSIAQEQPRKIHPACQPLPGRVPGMPIHAVGTAGLILVA